MQTTPLKYLVSYNDEVLPEKTDPDYEFDYIEIGSVEYGKGITSTERMTYGKAPSRARRIVKKGDVIISTVRTYLKAVAYINDSHDEQIASTGFAVLRPINIYDRFLYYSVLSDDFIQKVEANSVGISYPAITATKLMTFKIPTLPLYEQQAIATYLDDRCSKIDAIIAEAKASIEEYKELKQAVIYEAVTKGLDKKVEMKDSGVEWIGEIPGYWTLKRFKYVARIKSNLVDPNEYMEYYQIAPDCIEKDSGTISTNRLVKDAGVISGNHLFHKGQILYSKIRPVLNKVAIAPYDGLCSADMYPLDAIEDTKFVAISMQAKYFVSQVELITRDRVKMPKINQEELGNIFMPIPPRDIQYKIVEYINKKNKQLDSLISEKQSLIEDLEAYKKSLIYEVVTGKRKVVA